MANGPLLHIQIRGGDTAIIGEAVLAVVMPPPNAATWIAESVGDGMIQFTDQASGLVLGAREFAAGTPAEVNRPETLGVTAWRLTQYSDGAEDDPSPVKEAGALTSGFYAIREPMTGAYLQRDHIEDYSVRPKRVALQPGDVDPGPVVIRVVG